VVRSQLFELLLLPSAESFPSSQRGQTWLVIREVVSVREWSELIMKLFPVSRRAHSGRIPDDKLAQQLGYERIKLRELMKNPRS